MMSGPAPAFAATAALGRTSSQLSLSTRTSMPVVCVNLWTLARYCSSSPCTKRFQRSTRSLAPFSGWLVHCAWALAGHSSGSDTAAAPAEAFFRNLRRSVMLFVSWVCDCERRDSAGQAHTAGGIEQVRARRVGAQADDFARPERMPVAEHARELDAGKFGEHLRVGTGRLDHYDLGGHAFVAAGELHVLGARPEEDLLAVLCRRGVRRCGQPDAFAELHARA